MRDGLSFPFLFEGMAFPIHVRVLVMGPGHLFTLDLAELGLGPLFCTLGS